MLSGMSTIFSTFLALMFNAIAAYVFTKEFFAKSLVTHIYVAPQNTQMAAVVLEVLPIVSVCISIPICAEIFCLRDAFRGCEGMIFDI